MQTRKMAAIIAWERIMSSTITASPAMSRARPLCWSTFSKKKNVIGSSAVATTRGMFPSAKATRRLSGSIMKSTPPRAAGSSPSRPR